MHTATRSFLALTIANGVGQAIAAIGGVALAAVFAPADFGRFSLYANVLGVVVLVGTLRCDQYLQIGDLEGTGAVRRELALGAAASTVSTGILTVGLLLLGLATLRWPGLRATLATLAAVPVSCFLGCLGSLALAALMRADRIARIVVVNNARIIATLALQIALLPLLGGWALIAGAAVGLAVAFALSLPGSGLIAAVRGAGSDPAPRRRWRDLGGHLRLSGQVLLSESSTMIIGSLILAAYGATVAGVYYLAFRVLQMPLNLTYIALRQGLVVGLREDDRREGEHPWRWLRRLPLGLRLGFGAVLATYAAVIAGGGWAERLLLGTAWAGAGEYGRWIAMYLFSSIATIPAHAVLMRLDRTGVILAFSALGLGARVIAVLAGALISARAMVAGFGIGSAVIGAAFLVVALRLFQRHQPAAGTAV